MTPLRWGAAAVLAVLAVLLQSVLLARLPLPGPVPDLAVLVVIGVALVAGANGGAVTGFLIGLLVALAPPSDAAVGAAAIAYAVVGYLVGSRAAGERLSRVETAGLASACGAASTGFLLALESLLGPASFSPLAAVLAVGFQAIYCAILGLLVTPGVAAAVTAVPGRA